MKLGHLVLNYIDGETWELIKDGTAKLVDGAVRYASNGQILKFVQSVGNAGFKNVAGAVLNSAGSIVNTFSGLASNVQQVFIQKSIDTANVNITSVGDTVNIGFEQMGTSFENLGNTVTGGFQQMGAAIGGVQTSVTTGFQQMGAAIGGVQASVTSGFQQTSAAIGGVQASMATGFQQMGTTMGGMIGQMDAITAGVNTTIGQLNSISTTLLQLQTISALSWVGTSFNIANFAVSVAGYRMTMKKMNEIQDQIQEFYDRYKEDRAKDEKKEFEKNWLRLQDSIGELHDLKESGAITMDQFERYKPSIQEHIGDSLAFVRNIMSDPEKMRMTIPLSITLTKLINDFCCVSYYVTGKEYHMLDKWSSFLSELNTAEFKRAVKDHLVFNPDYAGILPSVKQHAYMTILEGIREPMERFTACRNLIETMSFDDYVHMDDILNQQLYMFMQAQLPAGNQLNFDEVITQKIKNGEYVTVDNDENPGILVSIEY